MLRLVESIIGASLMIVMAAACGSQRQSAERMTDSGTIRTAHEF
jgi:hypothetical protein